VPDLIRLLPDGASAAAVIIVVMLFLKQQDRINLMVEAITKGFNEQVNGSQKLYQDQIQSLIDAHIKVSRETILALKSLEASLKDAKDRGFIKLAGRADG
jgi:hypothetical protein